MSEPAVVEYHVFISHPDAYSIVYHRVRSKEEAAKVISGYLEGVDRDVASSVESYVVLGTAVNVQCKPSAMVISLDEDRFLLGSELDE